MHDHAALVNEVRYSERLCQRTARLYRRLQAAGTVATVLGGSAALSAAVPHLPAWAGPAGLVTAAVFGALLLALRRRPVLAMGALGLAIGVKVWPVLLAPLLLRPWLGRNRHLIPALGVLGALCLAWVLPIWLGGLDQRSGFVAYAGEWQANGALLPTLRDAVVKPVLAVLGLPVTVAGQVTRAGLAATAALAALLLAWRSTGEAADVLGRAATLTLVLVLVSPAQFPWYMLWTLPLLPFAPRLGVAAMAVTLPLYYLSFYFSAHGAYEIFRDRIVWLIWVPIWLILALEALARRTPSSGADAQIGQT